MPTMLSTGRYGQIYVIQIFLTKNIYLRNKSIIVYFRVRLASSTVICKMPVIIRKRMSRPKWVNMGCKLQELINLHENAHNWFLSFLFLFYKLKDT
jgi:hypothetical protein